MGMGQTELQLVVVVSRHGEGRLACRRAMKLQCGRIEGDVTSEYGSQAAVRENVPDVIGPTNKP